MSKNKTMSRSLYLEKLLKYTNFEEHVLQRKSTRELENLYKIHCAPDSKVVQHQHDQVVRTWKIFDDWSDVDVNENVGIDNRDEGGTNDSTVFYEKISKEFFACYGVYERIHASVQACREFMNRNEQKLNELDKKVLQMKIRKDLKQLNILYKRLFYLKVTVDQGLKNTQLLQTDLMQSLQNMTEDDQNYIIAHFSNKINKFQSMQEMMHEKFQHLVHVLQRP